MTTRPARDYTCARSSSTAVDMMDDDTCRVFVRYRVYVATMLVYKG